MGTSGLIVRHNGRRGYTLRARFRSRFITKAASKIRAIRPPEPYKGKGIKYVEETIKRKVGKTGAA